MTDRQPERLEHRVGPRTLHGQHAVRAVLAGHLDAFGRSGCEPAHHLGGVGRVRHQQHLVVRPQVGDEVVHDAARLVAAQRVLGLAGRDPTQVVGERRVHELGGTRSAHERLAEVADVEQAGPLAHRRVLLDHAAAGVLDRHQPATEVGGLGAEGHVPVVQGRAEQVVAGHGGQPR
nr:hypothetical protein [Angustibacter aerolatus]